jgi:tetratricopeptide (TPR) repeat protein
VAGILSLHYFEAGEYQPAWRYSIVAAKRAEGAYADVEAAGLYARAMEAGSKLTDLGQPELAGVQQAMGDAWYRAGEFAKASEAYTHARPLVASDRLTDGGLLLKLSHVEEKLGNYAAALRWTERARDSSELSGPEAARQTARSSAWYATLLQAEGRTTEALEWTERTLKEAEAADDAEATADAFFVMGWAYGDRARQGGAPLAEVGAEQVMKRSLEAYQRAGNVVREAEVLGTLGVICQWEVAGRGPELLRTRSRGGAEDRQRRERRRDTRQHGRALTERGEWAQASDAAGNAPREGGAVSLLPGPLPSAPRARVAARAASTRRSPASKRPGELSPCGRREDLPGRRCPHRRVPHRDGQARGGPRAGERDAGNATDQWVASVVPLLERIQGHALLRQGDLWGARDALEASPRFGAERKDHFEATLTILAIELDRLEGVEPPGEMVTETRTLLANRKVRAVPPVPLPPT